MIFQSGKIYLNNRTGRHISVLETIKQDDNLMILGIQEVDPDTMKLLFYNEITINASDIDDWEYVELI